MFTTGALPPNCHARFLCCAALSTTSHAVSIAGTMSFPAGHFTAPPNAKPCAPIGVPPKYHSPAIPPCANLPSVSVGINGMLMPHMLFAAVINLLKALIALLINHSITATMPLKMLFDIATSQSNIVVKAPAIASFAPINKSLIQLTPSVNAVFIFTQSVLAIHTIAVPIVVKKLRIIVRPSSHANLMLSINHWKSPENNALKALKIAIRYSPYVPNVSVIHCRAASHAIVNHCVIDDRVSVIHVTNGSITDLIYAIPFVNASFIVSQFAIINVANVATIAIIIHTGQVIAIIATFIAANHATIDGIASHKIPITLTSPATAQPIHIIQAKISGFSFAHDAKANRTGCTVDNNIWKAGANAPPIASCKSPNDSLKIADCPATVSPNAFACHPTFSINAPIISCLLAVSDTSIPYSFNIFWLPASAIVTTFVADHISICFATDRSAANVASFVASVLSLVICKSLAKLSLANSPLIPVVFCNSSPNDLAAVAASSNDKPTDDRSVFFMIWSTLTNCA